ncbi:MAG: hypothetical protein ABJ205_00235 [Erythrobacter sp.]|uniref:hypothetical protein n=1 Tax=Erythrobacter sp. TaxID=1042 RepID=UPI00326763FD
MTRIGLESVAIGGDAQANAATAQTTADAAHADAQRALMALAGADPNMEELQEQTDMAFETAVEAQADADTAREEALAAQTTANGAMAVAVAEANEAELEFFALNSASGIGASATGENAVALGIESTASGFQSTCFRGAGRQHASQRFGGSIRHNGDICRWIGMPNCRASTTFRRYQRNCDS